MQLLRVPKVDLVHTVSLNFDLFDNKGLENIKKNKRDECTRLDHKMLRLQANVIEVLARFQRLQNKIKTLSVGH